MVLQDRRHANDSRKRDKHHGSHLEVFTNAVNAMRTIEVMICVDLLRRDEHLWSNFVCATIDRDVIDGEITGFKPNLILDQTIASSTTCKWIVPH